MVKGAAAALETRMWLAVRLDGVREKHPPFAKTENRKG
jgi:hypothetical protein